MTKAIHVELDDEEYDRIRPVKDFHGLTWREVIMRGVETLDLPGSPESESEE